MPRESLDAAENLPKETPRQVALGYRPGPLIEVGLPPAHDEETPTALAHVELLNLRIYEPSLKD